MKDHIEINVKTINRTLVINSMIKLKLLSPLTLVQCGLMQCEINLTEASRSLETLKITNVKANACDNLLSFIMPNNDREIPYKGFREQK